MPSSDSLLSPVSVAPSPRGALDVMPRHVAIIMDGNGRWANARGLARTEGHREGARAVRRVVTRARELNLEVLTLYAFSAQNWRRPEQEIETLMALLVEFCTEERPLLMEKQIRFRVIGQRSRLSQQARDAVEALESITADHDAMELVLALSYGGREEILAAARRVALDHASGTLDAEALDEDAFNERLWTAGLPDPDLMIRTSGEFRVSNFLLWQIAYAELYVDQRMWPDYDAQAFDEALRSYGQRERRFGAVPVSSVA